MLPLILLVAALQAAGVPRDRVPRATVSGRITEKDTNRPIPRALVSLQPQGAADTRQTITDADGRYAFSDVDSGKYALSAAPGELIATHLDQAFGQSSPLLPGVRPPAALVVKPGESLTGVDIALVRALAIEGRVLDPSEDPIADAAVVVSRPDGPAVAVMPGYSDDRGEYRVFGLAAGRYRVCAAPQGLFPSFSDTGSKAVRTCHLAAVSESNAVDVLLEDADVAGIDIRMQRTGTYAASGSVLDASGVAVDGASVTASRDDHMNGAHATTRDGQFTLAGLTPGRYHVQASVGGRASPDDLRPPAREREWGYTSMNVDGGDLSNVVVTIEKPQRVSGRVVFEETPPSGSLHMAVQMGAAPDMWDMITSRPPVGAVDDRLTFQVSELYRAPLVVLVQGLPDGWVVRSVRYDRRDITDQAVDFGAPAADRSIEIRLTSRVARPRVRVTDEQGRPASAYQILIMRADRASSNAMNFAASVRPSDDGAVSLDPMLPGDYLIAAVPWEDALVLSRERERLDTVRASARRVTITEGDNQTIDLRVIRLPPTRQ